VADHSWYLDILIMGRVSVGRLPRRRRHGKRASRQQIMKLFLILFRVQQAYEESALLKKQWQ
jgi:hypothetical protein